MGDLTLARADVDPHDPTRAYLRWRWQTDSRRTGSQLLRGFLVELLRQGQGEIDIFNDRIQGQANFSSMNYLIPKLS